MEVAKIVPCHREAGMKTQSSILNLRSTARPASRPKIWTMLQALSSVVDEKKSFNQSRVTSADEQLKILQHLTKFSWT